MSVEVKVLVPLPYPDAALGIEIGSPLCTVANTYGALCDAERVGGFLKGGVGSTVATSVVEVGFNVQIRGRLQRQCVMKRPLVVTHLAERLRESRRRKIPQEPLLMLIHGLCIGSRGVFPAQCLLHLVAFRMVAEF